jgi:glycosyltransferase involved in cell wall biosynthesis
MNKKTSPFFTVFTPSFNRRHTLKRVYDGLRQQTFVDFEWVIVDDGSSDNTREIVTQWIKEPNPFRIEYIYKANGGKNSAHTMAVAKARGFGLVTIDSDDWLLPTALDTLKREWDGVVDKDATVGVCGLFQYTDGQIVGDPFPSARMLTTAIDLRHNLRNRGDKIGFNRLDVLRAFPFPQVAERYTPESVIWNRISQRYKTLFINERVGVKEYQAGGITDLAYVNSRRYPKGYYLLHSELVDSEIPVRLRSLTRSLVTAQKCSFYCNAAPFVPKRLWHRVMALGVTPIVLVAMVRDLLRRRRLTLRAS